MLNKYLSLLEELASNQTNPAAVVGWAEKIYDAIMGDGRMIQNHNTVLVCDLVALDMYSCDRDMRGIDRVINT